MSKIELEQKYVLDLNRRYEMLADLRVREGDKLSTQEIRQCYISNLRYRATETDGRFRYLKETKTGLKIGTPYSISLEDEVEIDKEFFDLQWAATRRRLQKTRYEVMLAPYERRMLMVDCFHTGPEKTVYAVVAEVEKVLDADSHSLDLWNFSPPMYLLHYILKVIKDNDLDSKSFKSINMIDTPESINNIARAYQELYDRPL